MLPLNDQSGSGGRNSLPTGAPARRPTEAGQHFRQIYCAQTLMWALNYLPSGVIGAELRSRCPQGPWIKFLVIIDAVTSTNVVSYLNHGIIGDNVLN